jgi:hypothetical protein
VAKFRGVNSNGIQPLWLQQYNDASILKLKIFTMTRVQGLYAESYASSRRCLLHAKFHAPTMHAMHHAQPSHVVEKPRWLVYYCILLMVSSVKMYKQLSAKMGYKNNDVSEKRQ